MSVSPDDDRQRDADIATKIMGWTDVLLYAYTPSGVDVCGTPPKGVQSMWSTGRSVVPHYSTRIEDAWLIVEHLHSQGFDYDILSDGDKVRVIFCDDPDEPFAGSGDTAAAAIVAAALSTREERP